MVLSVNGFDLVPYIAHNGYKWQLSDIDGPDTGRMSDGLLHRSRIATKIRFDLTMRPLRSDELQKILQATRPEFYTLAYYDPITGTLKKEPFYSNNFSVGVYGIMRNGEVLYTGLVLPLIQR